MLGFQEGGGLGILGDRQKMIAVAPTDCQDDSEKLPYLTGG